MSQQDDAIDAAIRSFGGWFTVREVANQSKQPASAVRARLGKLVESGALEEEKNHRLGSETVGSIYKTV